MKRRFAIIALLLVSLGLVLGGCAPTAITGKAKVQQEAFGKKKKYALVTIASAKEFYGEKGLGQMFKKSDDIPGMNTQPIIDKLAPKIRTRFAKTGYFTSVPKKHIVSSKAYKSIQEDPRVQKVLFMKVDLNTAKGYKYISDPKKLAKLAKDLKVDGVICVLINFSIQSMKSGMHVAGISFGKKEYASTATISALAYDREGKMVWKDSTIKQAEPGDKKAIVIMDFSDMTKTRFEKLHPSAVLIGGYATDVLVERFVDTIEGRGTSSFQKIKDKKTKETTKKKI
jgi:hypothetical protein